MKECLGKKTFLKAKDCSVSYKILSASCKMFYISDSQTSPQGSLNDSCFSSVVQTRFTNEKYSQYPQASYFLQKYGPFEGLPQLHNTVQLGGYHMIPPCLCKGTAFL